MTASTLWRSVFAACTTTLGLVIAAWPDTGSEQGAAAIPDIVEGQSKTVSSAGVAIPVALERPTASAKTATTTAEGVEGVEGVATAAPVPSLAQKASSIPPPAGARGSAVAGKSSARTRKKKTFERQGRDDQPTPPVHVGASAVPKRSRSLPFEPEGI